MQERAIVQQAILDRWNPHRLTKKICDTFGLGLVPILVETAQAPIVAY